MVVGQLRLRLAAICAVVAVISVPGLIQVIT
jgi:hypothetical protein